MDTFILLIVSSITLTITFWIHRHTYYVKYQHGKYVADLDYPMPFPRWALLIIVVVSFLPLINIIMFIIGMVVWLMSYATDEIRLGNLPKGIKSILEFLTKEV